MKISMRHLLVVAVSLVPILCRGETVLLFPERSLFQFTIGVSVPVTMNKRGSVVFSVGFQFNYGLPSNLSQLEPTVMPARQSRDLTLRDTYAAIENLLDRIIQPWLATFVFIADSGYNGAADYAKQTGGIGRAPPYSTSP